MDVFLTIGAQHVHEVGVGIKILRKTIPVSEQNNTLNIKHWIEQSTETNNRKQKSDNKTGNK
jgi:hypothetical protein